MYAIMVLAIVSLLCAVSILVISNNRYRRTRKRIARLERRDAELLGLLKATAARQHAETRQLPPVLRSEWGEDLLLLELFGWSPRGFYIEIGAYDGRRYAVTNTFEQLGWEGLLIEPVPELCRRAQANRPRARVVNAAVSVRGSSGTTSMTHILPRRDGAADASSHLQSSSGHLMTKRPPAGATQTIEVPLTTIDDLLDDPDHPHPGTIDLISIDVEGHELDLLDGFDLKRFSPRAILIEDHAMTDDSPIARHLRANGYTHAAWFAWNRLFISGHEPELLERAKDILQHLENPPR